MRFRQLPSRLLPALALAACGGAEGPPIDDFGYAGTGIGVTIAPLELPGITDACYSFQIQNGQGQTVVARGGAVAAGDAAVAGQGGDGGPTGLSGAAANPLCSTRFGNSQGALSYVAPCDASTTPDGNENHSVTLWVNSVCQDGSGATLFDPDTGNGCVPLNGFVNPCGPLGCTVTAQCVENADTPVSFNFTVMASAQQGFFDVAVNFDNVFCSAKLDTCHGDDDDNVTPIALVHNPNTGSRGHTAVAAVACSAGAGQGIETALYYTDFVVTCGDDVYTLDLSEIEAEGNVSIPNQDATETLHAAVFFGREDLPDQNKVYTNVAFILPDTGAPCYVNWNVIPTRGDPPPNPEDDPPGTFTQVSGVTFGPPEGSTDPGAVVQYGHCHSHVMNSFAYTLQLPLSAMANLYGTPLPSGVYTGYVEETPEISAQIALQESNFSRPSRCRGPTWVHQGTLTIDANNPPPPNYECISSIQGGGLNVEGLNSPTSLYFERLESVPAGSIAIVNNTEPVSVTFPALNHVIGAFRVNDNDDSVLVDAGPLNQAMQGPVQAIGNAASVDFRLRHLTTASTINVQNNLSTANIEISLDSLTSNTGTLLVTGNACDIDLTLPSLSSNQNEIVINSNGANTVVNAPVLSVSDMIVMNSNTGPTTLNAPSLTRTGGPGTGGGGGGTSINGNSSPIIVNAPLMDTWLVVGHSWQSNSGGGTITLGMTEIASLTIQSNADLDISLPSLSAVTGSLTVSSNNAEGSSITISAPELISAGQYSDNNSQFLFTANTWVDATFPKLEFINGYFGLLNHGHINFTAPALKHIRRENGSMLGYNKGGFVTLGVETIDSTNYNIRLEECENFTVNLPNLVTPSGWIRVGWSENTVLNAPLIPSVYDFAITGNGPGVEVHMSSLASVGNNFFATENTSSVFLELPALSAIVDLIINSNQLLSIGDLGLTGLSTVAGWLVAQNNSVISNCDIDDLIASMDNPPSPANVYVGDNAPCD